MLGSIPMLLSKQAKGFLLSMVLESGFWSANLKLRQLGTYKQFLP